MLQGMESVRIHPDLVWDYREPPDDLLWRLQRIADAFPAYGRDRATVRLLHAHRDELRLDPERRMLIELYEQAWCEREDRPG
jgi:hypothetical protein